MRDYLKKRRSELSLTQDDVAKICGLSRAYYQMIEAGERQKNMDITLAVKLADALGVSIEEIIASENR